MPPVHQTYIAYYRVSTSKQGESGLGLEAQRSACRTFVGATATIAQEFKEVESGKRNQRPQLEAAIIASKQADATLLIAKLDRLSRNASFIFALRDAGVKFVCCDMPDANTLTIGIFATLAQHERELISTRTKDALAALKARGVRLGTPTNLNAEARTKGHAARRASAQQNRNNQVARELAGLYHAKGMSTRQIAEKLNQGGHKTSRGFNFQSKTVHRLLPPPSTFSEAA